MQNSGLLVKQDQIINYDPEAYTKKVTVSLPLSRIEAITKYRGFDGEVWPHRELFEKEGILIPEVGLVELKHFRKLSDVYRQLPTSEFQYSLLFLSHDLNFTFVGTEWQDDFLFYGYDYGNYISEYNFFSCVVCEVLFGDYKELRKYAPRLNENLLFPDLNFLNDYRSDRQTLVQRGADLEDEFPNEPYEPIKIWGWKNREN